MDAAQLRRAFDAFSQADMYATRRLGGKGIGLAPARQLTALPGGDMQASSRAGEGSTFYVTVPVNVEAEVRVV